MHPYCRECGSENLAYLEQYANGSEYKCRVCGATQMDGGATESEDPMTNETTVSERERFEREAFGRVYDEVANRREITIRQIAWHCWKAARAALPAPADQPPEPQGSSGSLSEIRRTAQVAEAAWWCKNAVRHVRFVSIDAASSIDDRAAAVRAAEEAIDKLVAML